MVFFGHDNSWPGVRIPEFHKPGVICCGTNYFFNFFVFVLFCSFAGIHWIEKQSGS